ncbi:MAG: hypothetical protein ACKO96_09800 [Flammeovirgaceae bacterium]
MITQFEGRLVWCMYNYKSTKNYVIEPLIFYYRRRELKSGDDKKLYSSFDSKTYLEIMKDAIWDLEILSKHLSESFSPR